jgi:hypothetical protein
MINLRNLVKRPITDKCCENSAQWKGDEASYQAIHNWIIVHYGKAVKCRKCGTRYKGLGSPMCQLP